MLCNLTRLSNKSFDLAVNQGLYAYLYALIYALYIIGVSEEIKYLSQKQLIHLFYFFGIEPRTLGTDMNIEYVVVDRYESSSINITCIEEHMMI